MSRLRRNNLSGTITDNPLSSGATTINSASFASLPVVAAPETLIMILDPQAVGGTPEIVRVTAHTAAATSVTVVRGQEGSSARSHVFGTTWMHGPVVTDWISLVTSSTRPSVPYRGQLIYESDTDKYVARRVNDTWVDAVPLGAWQTYTPSNTNINIVDGSQVARFTRIGSLVVVTYRLIFGASTNFTGNIQVGLPFTAGATSTDQFLGPARYFDSGTNNRTGNARIVGTQSSMSFAADSDVGDVNATRPFTWAVNDQLVTTITYETTA